MRQLFLKIIKRDKAFFLFLLFVLICLLVNLAIVVRPPRLTGESVSTVLMATSPLRNLGVPYRDYWGKQAPGILFLVGLWVNTFGFSVISLKILHFLVLLGIGILIFFILKKVFSSFYTLFVGAMVVVVLFSPYLNFGFLPNELFGLFFSLLGLAVLLSLKRFWLSFFLATFLISISGQMKDSFFFTILAIFPLLLDFWISGKFRLFRRAIIFILLGLISANFLIGAYLWRLGVIGSYWEILRFKVSGFDIYPWQNFVEFQDKFLYTLWHSRNIMAMFQSGIVILLQVWLVVFLLTLISSVKWQWLKMKPVKDFYNFVTPEIRLTFTKPKIDLNVLIIVFYSLGSFLGFYFQRVIDFRTLVQVIPPTFFFWSLVTKSIFNNVFKLIGLTKLRFLLFPLLILILFPKGPYLKGYLSLESYSPQYFIKKIISHLAVVNPNTEFEDYVAAKTSPDSCILSVYGWSVGETYYYAQRRPCTRFFLPSDVTMIWQREEYKKSLFENPPQAIVYSPNKADVKVDFFENEVINLSKIKGDCYQIDPKYPDGFFDSSVDSRFWLYFPSYKGDELKTCLRESSRFSSSDDIIRLR